MVTNNKLNSRINSIDSLRYISIIAVILLHCFPTTGAAKFIVTNLARFAVPFFFITSGFFLGLKLKNGDTKNYFLFIKKIFKLYIFWSLIYFINPDFSLINTNGFISSYLIKLKELSEKGIVLLLFEGISYHFWFFISLICAAIYNYLFKIKHIKTAIVVAFLFYLIGVFLNYGYYELPILNDFNSRYFIFFSALPFTLGVYIALKDYRLNNKWALSILGIGIIFQFIESYYSNITLSDYFLSTILMGIGLFLFALNNNSFLNSSNLAKLGSLTFGIYAIHILLAYRLIFFLNSIPFFQSKIYIWYPLFVLIVSTIAVCFLKYNKIFQRIGVNKYI